MTILEKTFQPAGGAAEGEWARLDCSELQVISWPDRDRALLVEYAVKGGRESLNLRPCEPGMRIVFAPEDGATARLKLSTVQPDEEILSQAHCILRALTYPEMIIEQPKQEAQGQSLTKGASVVVPTATETSLGAFTAWRTGILRVAGQVTVDPASLRFRLYSLWRLTAVSGHMMGDTGEITHSPLQFEYSLRDDVGSYFLPAVHAGRAYRLTVEHSGAGNRAYDCDVYIEPVNLC